MARGKHKHTRLKKAAAQKESSPVIRQDNKANTLPPARPKPHWLLKASSLIVSPWWRKQVSRVIVLVMLVGVFYSLRPKISCDLSGQMNTEDPFSFGVTLSNDGYTSVKDVSIACATRCIRMSNGLSLGCSGHEALMHNLKYDSTEISPGGKLTVARICPIEIRESKVELARIVVVVSYRPEFIPFHFHKRFPFVLVPNTSSGYLWEQKSAADVGGPDTPVENDAR